MGKPLNQALWPSFHAEIVLSSVPLHVFIPISCSWSSTSVQRSILLSDMIKCFCWPPVNLGLSTLPQNPPGTFWLLSTRRLSKCFPINTSTWEETKSALDAGMCASLIPRPWRWEWPENEALRGYKQVCINLVSLLPLQGEQPRDPAVDEGTQLHRLQQTGAVLWNNVRKKMFQDFIVSVEIEIETEINNIIMGYISCEWTWKSIRKQLKWSELGDMYMKFLPNTLWSPPSPLSSVCFSLLLHWASSTLYGRRSLTMDYRCYLWGENKKPFHLSWCCPIFLLPFFTFGCYTSTQIPTSLLLSVSSPPLFPSSSFFPPSSSSFPLPPLLPLPLSHPPGSSRDRDWRLEGRCRLDAWGV